MEVSPLQGDVVLAFVVALREEAKALLALGRWEKVAAKGPLALYQGQVAGRRVAMAVGAVGREGALEASRTVLAHFGSLPLVSAGFSGALAPELKPGDLVVARRLCRMERGERAIGPGVGSGPFVEPDGRLLALALRALEEEDLPYVAETCLTADRLVVSRGEKERLARLTGTVAVDMESAWVAAVAQEFGVPFLAVRAVLDPMNLELPPFLADVAGDASHSTLLLQALARPQSLPAMARLALYMRRAQRSLGGFALALLSRYSSHEALLTTFTA